MDAEYCSYTGSTRDGNVAISAVDKWSVETSTVASKDHMNLRLEDIMEEEKRKGREDGDQ